MDFEKARFNMVEQQIRPWDVLDFDVLDALGDIPREKFVGAGFQGLAYADKELPLPNGGKMLEPKVVARLVQGLKLTKQDKVLEIGTGSGYATAQLEAAKTVLDGIGCGNVRYVCNDALAQETEGAPFDAVYVGGSVGRVPETLKRQLKDGGRMAVIVGGKPVQRALLITRDGGVFREKVMFDTLAAGLSDKADKPFGDFDF